MTDKESVLRSILLKPEDDTVRLVYADILEDEGEGEEAWLIRESIRIHDRPLVWRAPKELLSAPPREKGLRLALMRNPLWTFTIIRKWFPRLLKVGDYIDHQDRLFNISSIVSDNGLTKAQGHEVSSVHGPQPVCVWEATAVEDKSPGMADERGWGWERGFFYKMPVMDPAEDMVEYFKKWPITEVDCDRALYENPMTEAYFAFDWVPKEVWPNTHGWGSVRQANRELSPAYVRYCRRKAGLG